MIEPLQLLSPGVLQQRVIGIGRDMVSVQLPGIQLNHSGKALFAEQDV